MVVFGVGGFGGGAGLGRISSQLGGPWRHRALPARFQGLRHRWPASAFDWGQLLTRVSLGGGVSRGLRPAGCLLPETPARNCLG